MLIRALRHSLTIGLLFALFIYFLSAPAGEMFHALYLSTDWEWAYVAFQVLMGLGTLVPWYGYGLPAALAMGVVAMIITFLLSLLTAPFRRTA